MIHERHVSFFLSTLLLRLFLCLGNSPQCGLGGRQGPFPIIKTQRPGLLTLWWPSLSWANRMHLLKTNQGAQDECRGDGESCDVASALVVAVSPESVAVAMTRSTSISACSRARCGVLCLAAAIVVSSENCPWRVILEWLGPWSLTLFIPAHFPSLMLLSFWIIYDLPRILSIISSLQLKTKTIAYRHSKI